MINKWMSKWIIQIQRNHMPWQYFYVLTILYLVGWMECESYLSLLVSTALNLFVLRQGINIFTYTHSRIPATSRWAFPGSSSIFWCLFLPTSVPGCARHVQVERSRVWARKGSPPDPVIGFRKSKTWGNQGKRTKHTSVLLPKNQ